MNVQRHNEKKLLQQYNMEGFMESFDDYLGVIKTGFKFIREVSANKKGLIIYITKRSSRIIWDKGIGLVSQLVVNSRIYTSKV
jgi:hypothetical protein